MTEPFKDFDEISNYLPDPDWDYAPLWEQLLKCGHEIKQALEILVDRETASPEADRRVKDHILNLRAYASQALNLVASNPPPLAEESELHPTQTERSQF